MSGKLDRLVEGSTEERRHLTASDEVIGAEERSVGVAPPRDASRRGSQVSFRFDNGYAAIQALIARGVVGDFRAPDIMRFGFTPLYIDIDDVRRAVEIIAEVMHGRLWARPEYSRKAGVT